MKGLPIIAVMFAMISVTTYSAGQSPGSSPTPGQKNAKTQTANAKTGGSPPNKLLGFDVNDNIKGPITTEIYADEAFFDSNKSVGIFRGKVKVSDPRFNLQSDKLTVFISKAQARQAGQAAGQTGQNGQTGEGGQGEQTQNQAQAQGQGLEKAIAEGNVAVVRDRPDPNGGPSTRAVGRAESATYVAATGDVELKGSPRVQQGMNTHIGTSPDTVMVINQSGQLTTHGPSRTEIRQEPKDENAEGQKGEKKAGGKDDKKAEKKEETKSPQPSPRK